jgi:hypothetical protein
MTDPLCDVCRTSSLALITALKWVLTGTYAELTNASSLTILQEKKEDFMAFGTQVPFPAQAAAIGMTAADIQAMGLALEATCQGERGIKRYVFNGHAYQVGYQRVGHDVVFVSIQ